MRYLESLTFIEVISRTGSIRQAAELLAITPSALNRRLLGLEDELGVPIFERLASGVRLNTAGELFVEHIRKQQADLERVRSQISDLSGIRRGTVKLVITPEISGQFVEDQIRAYRSAFPGVNFKVWSLSRGDAELALASLEADIALVFEPVKLADFQSTISIDQPLHCIMNANHPLASGNEVRLFECAEFPLLVPPSNWGLRDILDQAAVRLGIALRVSIETETPIRFLSQASTDGSLSFALELNRSDVAYTASGADLVALPVSPLDVPSGQIFAGHLRGRTLPVAAARFLEKLTQQLAEMDRDRV